MKITGKFQIHSLSTKLALSFLLVALIPLLVLTFMNNLSTSRMLLKDVRQSLFAAATQAAFGIDSFLKVHRKTIRTEAQLPVFRTS